MIAWLIAGMLFTSSYYINSAGQNASLVLLMLACQLISSWIFVGYCLYRLGTYKEVLLKNAALKETDSIAFQQKLLRIFNGSTEITSGIEGLKGVVTHKTLRIAYIDIPSLLFSLVMCAIGPMLALTKIPNDMFGVFGGIVQFLAHGFSIYALVIAIKELGQLISAVRLLSISAINEILTREDNFRMWNDFLQLAQSRNITRMLVSLDNYQNREVLVEWMQGLDLRDITSEFKGEVELFISEATRS